MSRTLNDNAKRDEFLNELLKTLDSDNQLVRRVSKQEEGESTQRRFRQHSFN